MRSDIENRIRKDAAADPAFCSALVANPATAIVERYGVSVPDGIAIRVVEEAADEVIIVLPSIAPSVVLSPSDLDAAVGAHSNEYDGL